MFGMCARNGTSPLSLLDSLENIVLPATKINWTLRIGANTVEYKDATDNTGKRQQEKTRDFGNVGS
jgi:hypothetical protein